MLLNHISHIYHVSIRFDEPADVYLLLPLSEGLAHSTVHHHLRQLSVYLQSGALIFISELPGVV